MRGLRASEWARKSCSLWLIGQVAVLGGLALPVIADEAKLLADQVKEEHEQQLAAIDELYGKAQNLAQQLKYMDADAAFNQVMSRLQNVPGQLAVRRFQEVQQAYAAFKATWSGNLLSDAREMYSEGNYKQAQQLASDAALVDGRANAKAQKLIEDCLAQQRAADYRSSIGSPEAIDPGYDLRTENIDLLMREAKVFYDAKAFDDARIKLEAVYLLDPYYQPAIELLEKVYNQLYVYGTARRKADILGMMAYMNWQGVEPVFPTAPRDEKIDNVGGSRPPSTGSGVMGKMEKIIFPRIEFDKQDIFTVINFLKRYSQQHDPDGEGVQIMALIPRQDADKLPQITMVFNKIPMNDVLRYVCQATGLKYRIDNGVVVIGKNVDEMQTETFSVRRDVISRLSEGEIDTTAGGLFPTRGPRANLPTGADALPFGGAAPFNTLQGGGAGAGGNTNTRGQGNTMMGPGMNMGVGGGGGYGTMPAMMRAPGVGKSSSSRSSSSSRRSSSSRSSSSSGSGSMRAGFDNMVASGGAGGRGGMGDVTGLGAGGPGDGRGGVATSFDPSQMSFAKRVAPVTSEALLRYFEDRGISFGNGAAIAYDPRSNKLQVKNTVENLRKMDNLLRQLNVEVPMVLVEARVVEVTETNMDQLGFDWFLSVPSEGSDHPNWSINSQAASSGSTGRSSNDNPLRNGDQYKVVNGLKIFPNFGESLFGSDSNVDLSLSINAVCQNKTSEVLTSPKVLTASDTYASVEMTESVYYPSDWEYDGGDDSDSSSSSSSNSNSWGNSGQIVLEAPTPQFDDGGTELGVIFGIRPIIGPDNYTITLDLNLSIKSYIGQWTYDYSDRVYTITTDANGEVRATLLNSLNTTIWMPIYGQRELTVKVKIYDGETIVLGGMIDSRTTAYDDKWPLLGDIPLIGRLFQSKVDNAEKTNLLIFVTTRLINNDGIPLRRDRVNRGVPDFNR